MTQTLRIRLSMWVLVSAQRGNTLMTAGISTNLAGRAFIAGC